MNVKNAMPAYIIQAHAHIQYNQSPFYDVLSKRKQEYRVERVRGRDEECQFLIMYIVHSSFGIPLPVHRIAKNLNNGWKNDEQTANKTHIIEKNRNVHLANHTNWVFLFAPSTFHSPSLYRSVTPSTHIPMMYPMKVIFEAQQHPSKSFAYYAMQVLYSVHI